MIVEVRKTVEILNSEIVENLYDSVIGHLEDKIVEYLVYEARIANEKDATKMVQEMPRNEIADILDDILFTYKDENDLLY